jgi:glycosyltransferase involved in cell wall biosynthesis
VGVEAMRFSIVIPAFNRKALLRRCLVAATNQNYSDYEVIVVDDGSTDGTQDMVCREFPQVRYFRQEVNRGPASARNRGILAAVGEVLAFTDDDCLLPADFLSLLEKGYRRHSEAGGVGGYLEAPDEVVACNNFAKYEAYVTHHVYGAGSEPYLGGFECPAGGTNSMSYRQDVLAAVGGFDETFPVPGGEDADLKWRIVQMGTKLLYVPVKVIHLQTYNLRRFWHQYSTHGRGAVYFERKYQGHPPSLRRLMLRGVARCARWFPGLMRLGLVLASVKLVAELADLTGQFQEIRRLRCESKLR